MDPRTGFEGQTIPVLRPQLPSADRLLPYLRQIDARQYYSNHGPLVLELERRLAKHLAIPPGGISTAASGTAALIGAILASAGRARPERPLALMPSFTFVATAVAAEQCGYRPFLFDVDPDTWMLDAPRLAKCPECDRAGITIPVSPFGRPVPQQPWTVFQKQTGIKVVIDGAASFEGLSEDPNRYLGNIPVALSFHATKSFATGEGGAIATNNLDLATRIVQALNFGFRDGRNSASSGINGKMSEYHAAVGLAELDEWPTKQAALLAVANCYRQPLRQMGLADRLFARPDIGGCYVIFRCADSEETARITDSLRKDGIEFRFWYGGGLHRQSYYARLPREPLDVTDRVLPYLLGLPVALDLFDPAITRIAAALATGIRAQEGRRMSVAAKRV